MNTTPVFSPDGADRGVRRSLSFPVTRRQSPHMSLHFFRTKVATLVTLVAGAFFLGACADRQVIDPAIAADPTAVAQRITCAVDVTAGDVSCAPATSGANLALTLGGQGTYVQLAAGNSSYASDIFQADITVRNLTGQKLGTSDGTTITGVKAFIASGPTVVSGTGAVSVNNADGAGTFTAANQPYFLYNQILHEFSGTSSAKTWRFNVPSTVTRFMFTVLVQAAAPIETGVLRWSTERGMPVSVSAVWGADSANVFACGNSMCFRSTPTGGWVSMTGALLGDSLGRTTSVMGMGGTSPTDIWAVGLGGLIAHYNGTTWSSYSPSPVSGQLNAVSAVSPTDVYAVGLTVNKVLHFNGTAWSSVLTLPSGGAFSVKALAANNVWVAGGFALYHWDGATWTTFAAPSGALFRGMWVFSNTDILVGGNVSGQSTIWRFDGTSFTATSVSAIGSIFGFWAHSPTDIIASDGSGNVLHYDGSAWTVTAQLPSAQVANIWASSPTDMYLTGYNGSNHIYHFDGTTVTNQGSTMAALNDIWGTSATNVYAVGNSGTILRNTGTGWFNEASGTTAGLAAIWGSSASDLWAVGNLGGSILHRDATSWSVVPKATSRLLRGVWGSSATSVWAVGDTGTIEKFDGTNWTVQSSGVTTSLRAVGGSGPSDVWAVGTGGTLLHFDGTSWSNAGTGVTTSVMSLADIYVISATNAWIVGSNTTQGFRVLLHWDGTAWTSLGGMNGPGAISCISASGANDVWVGGDWGVLFNWNGTAWRTVLTGASTWGCPYAASSTNVFVAGQNGVILHGTR
jgi:hypothetical protein